MRRSHAVHAVLAFALLFFGSVARAQSFDTRPGVWTSTSYSSVIDVGRGPGVGPRVWLDLQLRQRPPTSYDSVGDFVAIVRPAVGYAFVPGVALDVGYAWIPVLSDTGSRIATGQRVWTQLLLGKGYGRVNLSLRSRFELRFSKQSTNVGVRLNFLARVAVDLVGPLYLVVSETPFIELNAYGQLPPGLEENRAVVGLGLAANSWTRVELAYLNRWLPASTTGGRAQMQNIALMSVTMTPALRTKRAAAPPPVEP
jgi:hypothetical protein